MRHQPLAQLRNQASVVEAPPSLTPRQRLQRWAELLARENERLLRPLSFVEFYAPRERGRLRADDSPLAVAYADPVLRAAGLNSDSLGDGQAFFQLSDRDTHYLLCDCHWHGRMTGRAAAKRVRLVASPGPISRLRVALQTH
jgi:hypothetical protein